MTELFATFQVTSPIFLLMVLGFLTVKRNYIDQAGLKALAWFVMHLGVPAAIFNTLLAKSFSDIFVLDYFLVYGLGSILVFSLIFIVSQLRSKSFTQSSILALGGSLSNSILIGYPIVIQLFGPQAIVPFTLTIVVENLIIIPLALILADIGRTTKDGLYGTLGTVGKQLSTNPLIIAIVLGTLASLLAVKPPQVLSTSIEMLAGTVAGLALFTIGGLLVGLKPSRVASDVAMVTTGKLILHPLCILLALTLIPTIDAELYAVALILASMPMFSIYAVIGKSYNMGELCAGITLVTTSASFLTISIVIYLAGKMA